MSPVIRRFTDARTLIRAALALVTAKAHAAVAARGLFSLALSGGSTPLGLYAAMAREGFGAPLDKVTFFFGDERLVPPGDRYSNFGAIAPLLFTPLPIPVGNIHPMPVEILPPHEAAETYAQEIRAALNTPRNAVAVFDLVLLGLGPDGHTASLFPHSPALGTTDRLVAAVAAPTTVEPRLPRLTFTLPLINAARHLLVLTGTKGKEQALAKALDGPPDPATPASLLRRDADVTWLIEDACRT